MTNRVIPAEDAMQPMTSEQATRIAQLQAEVRNGWANLGKSLGVRPFSSSDENGLDALGATQLIPIEAVEAAARAIYLTRLNNIVVESDRAKMELVANRDARAAIEAAAPHLLAVALESAATTFSACSPEGEYSSTPQQVIDWLREQAAMHRPTP